MKNVALAIILFLSLNSCNQPEKEAAVLGSASESIIKETGKSKPENTSEETSQEVSGKNETIVPGKSIGLIKLNEQAEVVYKLLGKPNLTDAAMGKMLATWFTEANLSDPDTTAYQTNIFFVRNMGSAEESALAKQIRITAKQYKLGNGLAINSDLKTIQASFPEMKKAATYTSARTKQKIDVYHDSVAGITFEINKAGKCVGIGIQEPGKANFEVYSAVSSDLKKL
ncbi:hypothetical protein [Adhaeribacter terreus]|uniref:Lipoprotein n=1 Tax=Adhaeribacter terreus TaxID=529703 RepID=A0ABW0ED24_9BACT